MILDGQGRIVANVSQPMITFDTEADYLSWKATLPDEDQEKNFFIIKKYVQGPGILEAIDYAGLNDLPKYGGTLYIDVSNDTLYRWDTFNEEFRQIKGGT